jgi:hypothetical protein
MNSGHAILPRARLNPHGDAASICYILSETRYFDAHAALTGTRLPKRAVPTRTQVLPSSMATVKSFDMPIDNCVIFGKRTTDSSLNLRSSRK